MAVKDRPNRRLLRLGIIRLGYKKEKKYPGGKTVEYPVQADHFVLTDAPEIAALYGEQPRELDVLLPFADVERIFDAHYQVWAGGVLCCQGDGEYVDYATPFTTNLDQKGSTHVRNAPGDTLVAGGVARAAFEWNGTIFEEGETVPCPGRHKGSYPHCEACRLHGILKVAMADPQLFRFGYYQISTGSARNHDTILGTLETIPADKLAGLPCKLRLVEQQTSYQGDDGQRKKTRKWFLQLEPDPTLMRQLYERTVMALIEAPEPEPEPTPPPPDETLIINGSQPGGPDWDAFLAGTPVEDETPVRPPYAVGQQSEPPPEEPAGQAGQHEEQHWLDSTTRRRRFLDWTRNQLVLTDMQVLVALGVPKLEAYRGTAEQAQAAILKYVEDRASS